MFSVRRGKHKLILGLGSGGFSQPKHLDPEPGGPEGQLYDMVGDWQETGNLWLQHPEIIEELAAYLEQVQEQGFSRPGATA